MRACIIHKSLSHHHLLTLYTTNKYYITIILKDVKNLMVKTGTSMRSYILTYGTVFALFSTWGINRLPEQRVISIKNKTLNWCGQLQHAVQIPS